jgi:hypothetical protein
MNYTNYKCIIFKGRLYAVANSTIFSSDSGVVWGQEHIIFEDKKPRDLGLSITFTHHLLVLGAGRDIWSADGQIWNDSQATKKCTCDVKVIMCKGCQCGGD